MKLSERWVHFRPIGTRVWFEARFPLVAATCWGIVAYFLGRDFFTLLSSAAAAFFFILFAQGQVLRIAKNVRDERDADDFRASFASLQQGLDELRKRGIVHQPSRAAGQKEEPLVVYYGNRVVSLGYEGFLAEAMQSVEAGRYYAGVLVAAVGFEYAARRAAEQLGIDDTKMPLGRLLRELGRRTENPRAAEALATLNRLRNSFVHVDAETPQLDRSQAIEFIDAFSMGVTYIDGAA